jgi:serine/threonine-protein kinase
MLEAGTIVAERFRLVRQLGMGGMGAVWLAQHTQLDVPCAIKFIHAHVAESAEIRARFEREAKAAAALRSPNVVGILDHGIWNGTPYIAMEYLERGSLRPYVGKLEGEDLDGRLARQGRLAATELVPIISQVARALSKAHAAGLIHRDIKPANIFLTRDEDQEIAKVLDFGIAKSNLAGLGDSATKTGSVLGTPFYMSPEQAQGTRAVDHRADLWSLAIVVFQCLTGELPFKSEAFGDLLMKIMMEPIPRPSTIAPLPPGFDAWWARAATRDPAGRFQSAREFAEALALSLGVSFGGAAAVSQQRDPWTFDPALHGQQSSPNAQSSPHAERASHPQFAMVGPNGPAFPGMQTGGGPTQSTLVVTGRTSGAAAPRKANAGLAVVAVLATLAVIGAAVFFFVHGDGGTATVAAAPAAPSALVDPAKSAEIAPSAAAFVEPAPSATTSATADARSSAEPEPPLAASAEAHAPPPTVPARPAPPRPPAAKPAPTGTPSAKPSAKPANGMNYGI